MRRRRPEIKAASGSPPALILGLDSITGLQTARLLAVRGIPVTGVVRRHGHFAARSRMLEEVREARPEDTSELLESFGRQVQGPFVVIPCSDSWVTHLVQSRSGWPSHLRAVVSEVDTVETLMDKGAFAEFAVEHGFPVPDTMVIHQEDDVWEAAARIGFPAVVKPARKPADWDRWMGGKVAIVRGLSDLCRVVDRGLQRADRLVVQRWVAGPDDHLISYNGYFDRHGQPRASFVARKTRQWPPGAGTSASGVEVRDDQVAELATELFQKAGFCGLAYLEVKRSAEGPQILEANVGRPTGRSAICEAGGVELVYAAYQDALGLPLPGPNQQRYAGAKWVYMRHDVQSALVDMRAGRLSFREWRDSMEGPKVFAVWSRNDPLPFLFDLGQAVGRALVGDVVRRRRPAQRHAGG